MASSTSSLSWLDRPYFENYGPLLETWWFKEQTRLWLKKSFELWPENIFLTVVNQTLGFPLKGFSPWWRVERQN